MEKWLVVARMGSAEFADVIEAETREAAEAEVAGIIEAGGNVWGTADGFPPEGAEDEGYEILVVRASCLGGLR